MSAIAKTATPRRANPLLAERLERLRLQVVASELATIVGRNIAAARIEKGINTQRGLSEKIREAAPEMAAGNTRVSVWERGAEKPSDRYMDVLTQVLGKPTDWFYTDHDKPEETPDLIAEVPAVKDEPEWVGRLEDKLDRVLRLLGDDPDQNSPEETVADVVARLIEAAESRRERAPERPATPPATRRRKTS